MEPFVLNNQWISIEAFENCVRSRQKVVLGTDARNTIEVGFEFLRHKVQKNDTPYYGINTGFGAMCNTQISPENLQLLQVNLLRSHACGMGEQVPNDLVKRMLLLKAIALAKGNSGVQVATVERLLFFYNHDVLPVVYEQGSLGASGDLIPLAHLCLPIIGEGKVKVDGKIIASERLQDLFQIKPIELQPKEGLALLNGTQFMSAYNLGIVSRSERLLYEGLTIAALSLEAMDGRQEPFQANVNELRHQFGQIQVAEHMRNLLMPSDRKKAHVQDPYSIRCIPQVHGASLDVILYAKKIAENELNAVTDNPTVFPEKDEIISAGNFHGQPLALTLDFLAIGLAELGSISERRIYKLISGYRNLPSCLVENAGLNSGLMIVQYLAASIVSQNKQLCTPSSVDTLDTSMGQEDHVSMGANAATKCWKILDNVISVSALEWIVACQAFDFRKGWRLSKHVESLYKQLRTEVPFLENDRNIHIDIETGRKLLVNRIG